jgi:hypothetical protein
MPLRLHGITVADGSVDIPTRDLREAEIPVPGATGTWSLTPKLVPFRDLCAIVSEQRNFTLDGPTRAAMDFHRSVVDAVFRTATVLPAPVGVIFRAPDVLKHWMELHYVSLTGAVEFVEDRVAARVHVVRAESAPDERETGSDLAAEAAESLRALRRQAVSTIPLRRESVTGLALSSAFLIERTAWRTFVSATDEQRSAHHMLQFNVSGPWAPYDFINMQFG